MIKHVVAFRFKANVPEDERINLLAELNEFPKCFRSVKHWSLSANISRRDDTFTRGFIVEFDTEDELLTYLGSEAHDRFVTKRFRPLIKRQAIISLRV